LKKVGERSGGQAVQMGGPVEHASERILYWVRARAQTGTMQMGRMGAGDPSILSSTPC
jgi:hypothetical protein